MLTETDAPKPTEAQAKAAYLRAYRDANPGKYKLYAERRNAKVKEARRIAREAAAPPKGQKLCTDCRILKPATPEFFFRRPSRPAGLLSWCKECCKRRNARWRSDNSSAIKANRQKRYEENGHKIRAQVYEYRVKNPEKVRQARRRYWAKDTGGRRLRRLMTGQINKSLRTVCSGGKSRRSWQTLLGYTVVDLMRHLERQFTPKMNWGNRGTYWELDHIRPVASFDITGPDSAAFLECWGILNLRPLEKAANRRKWDNRTLLL